MALADNLWATVEVIFAEIFGAGFAAGLGIGFFAAGLGAGFFGAGLGAGFFGTGLGAGFFGTAFGAVFFAAVFVAGLGGAFFAAVLGTGLLAVLPLGAFAVAPFATLLPTFTFVFAFGVTNFNSPEATC